MAQSKLADWDRIVHNEHIKKWLEQSKSLHILVTGKTGMGKSALVNGLIGKCVAKEGETLEPETSKVTEYRAKIGDVDVIIYDSPGLQDRKCKEDEYLKDMEKKCKKIDLILYCTSMTDNRIRMEDRETMEKLSNAFGPHFWKNALFVLTFANRVSAPLQFDNEPEQPLAEHFEERLLQWQTELRKVLCEVGVEKQVADTVPAVPAGYHSIPSLPASGYEFWLSNLWFKCLDRTADAAKPAFLKINWNRLCTPEDVTKEDIGKQKAYDQPIVYDKKFASDSIPPEILEFLGLAVEGGTVAGEVGKAAGGAVGFKIAGDTGRMFGQMAGFILAELIFKYGVPYLKKLFPESNPE